MTITTQSGQPLTTEAGADILVQPPPIGYWTWDTTAFTMDTTFTTMDVGSPIATLAASAAAGSATGPTVTTSGITTVTGDTFYVAVVTTSSGTVSVSDNKSNSYFLIGHLSDGGSRYIWRFYSTTHNGGSGHTFTGGVASGSVGVEVFAGALSGVSGAIAQVGSNTSTTAPPTSSGSVTTTQAAQVALTVYSTEYANASITFSEATTFNIVQSQTNGTGGIPAAAFAYEVTGVVGSYAASWSDGSTGSRQAAVIDTFFPAAAVAVTVTNQPFLLLNVG